MVRWARLELARVAPPPPQDGVSTIPPPAHKFRRNFEILEESRKDIINLAFLRMGLHKAKSKPQQAYK